MNLDYEKRLETAIDQELRGLPESGAPDSLLERVMSAIERRARVPWYRRSWQSWPGSARWVALTAMLVLFGCLCFAGWKATQTPAAAAASGCFTTWISGLSTGVDTLLVLSTAVALLVKKLGIGVLVALGVAAALAYALCMGLGTVYVRLAFAKR